MHDQGFFFQALIYLAAAVISVPVAKRLGLGSVLGYLLAGIAIGPYAFGFVGEGGEDVMHFAEFGVVMMLFLIGLELKPSLLWKMRTTIFGLGGLQVSLTTALIALLLLFSNLAFNQTLAIGLILALSSTAIVIQTLNEKGLLKNTGGQSVFSVLLFQDIAVIPILAVLPLLAPATSHSGESMHEHSSRFDISSLPGFQQLLLIIAVVAAIIFGGRFLARHIFRIIANTGLREIFTAAALLLIIAIAVAMDMVGLSPALGTFLAGVVLSENEYRHELESDIEPFKGLLLGLFFIAVGAGINFGLLFTNPGEILFYLGALTGIKFLVLFVLGRIFGLRKGHDTLFAFSLAQGGEFAFVLISFSNQNNILPPPVSETLLIVVALSMAITPLLLLVNEKLIWPRITFVANEKAEEPIDDHGNPVIIAGFGRFGMTVGRLLIANGIKVTILDNNPVHIKILRKFGFKVYYGDATRPDLLASAGAADAKVLIVAIDDRDKALLLVEHALKKYPRLKILARAADTMHLFAYFKGNLKTVQRETFDSAVVLGEKALVELGFKNYQAHRAAKTFKHHDERILEELYNHWLEDEKKFIKETQRFSEQLESMLMAEKDGSIHESEKAWDVVTLREEIRQIYSDADKDKN